MRAMKTVEDTRAQLVQLCERHGIPIVSCESETEPVRKALVCVGELGTDVGAFVRARVFEMG